MKRQLLGEKFDENDTYPLFQGYDVVNEKDANNKAIKGLASESFDGNSFCQFNYIQSTMDYIDEQRTNMSADVSLAGLFGVNGEINFAQSKEITTLTSSLLVYSKHISGSRSITESRFLEGRSPEDFESVKTFKKIYGDSFISSASKGGVFWMMVTFKSKSVEEKKNVEAKLKLNGVIKAITLEVGMETSLAEKIQSTNVDIEIKCGVSGLENPKLPEITDIEGQLKYATAFLNFKLTSPIIAAIQTKGYEDVLNSSIFDKIAGNRKYFTAINGINAKRVLLIKLRKAIDFAKCAYARYGITITDPKINMVDQKAKMDLETIENQYELYNQNPEEPLQPLNLESLNEGIPEVVFTVKSSIKYGGNEGGPTLSDIKSIADANTYFKNLLPRIVSIRMWKAEAGSFLDLANVPAVGRIELEFENLQRVASDLPQIENRYESSIFFKIKHGSSDGEPSQILHLNNFQKDIRQIEVRSGNYVDWLKFVSKSPNMTIESGNIHGGGYNKIAIEENHFFAGIETRSGDIIDSISFFTVAIEKINWPRHNVRKQLAAVL